MFESIRKCISVIYLDIASLCNSFLEGKLDTHLENARNLSFLVATGIAWKSALVFKSLPLTNALAVKCKIESQRELIHDAVREVQELLEEDSDQEGNENTGWNDIFQSEDVKLSSKELITVGKVLTLLKACNILFKKVGRTLETSEEDELVSQLSSLSIGDEQTSFTLMDQMPDVCERVAEGIDELACLLESPLPMVEIAEACLDLSRVMSELVDISVGLSNDDEWFHLMVNQVQKICEGLQVDR
jgi:hypothetical protein